MTYEIPRTEHARIGPYPRHGGRMSERAERARQEFRRCCYERVVAEFPVLDGYHDRIAELLYAFATEGVERGIAQAAGVPEPTPDLTHRPGRAL